MIIPIFITVLFLSGLLGWIFYFLSVRDKNNKSFRENGSNKDKLSAKLDMLRLIIESIPDMISVKDKDLRYILANKAEKDWMGVSDDKEIIGKKTENFIKEDNISRKWFEKEVFKSKQPIISYSVKSAIHAKENKSLLLSRIPIIDNNGEVTAIIGIAHEITKQKLTEEVLKKTEEKLKFLVGNINEAVYSVDAVTEEFSFISPSIIHILGFTVDEINEMGRNEFMISTTGEEAFYNAKSNFQILKSGNISKSGKSETWWRCKDGQLVYVQDSWKSIIQDGIFLGTYGVIHDITKRKIAEDALTKEREILQILMDSFPDTIYFKDTRSRFTKINKAQAKTLGLNSPEEAIGKTDFDFFTKEHAENAFNDEKKIINTGVPVLDKVEFAKTPTKENRWVSSTKMPIFDSENKITGIVGVSRDITERIEEDRKLEEYAKKLEITNKELEEFAYIASHDLQEPLRKIQTFSNRLNTLYGTVLGEQGNEYLTRMLKSVVRMRTLINDLLAFSRITTKAKEFSEVDLSVIIKEVITDLELRIEELSSNIEICKLPVIDAEPMQMRQLFQNLISNALKFHHKERTPVVKIYEEKADSHFCKITIEDNGIGIEEKYVDKIFQVFYRLHSKDEYEGTGIGLAICRKIAERHNGTITVNSSLNKGTKFTISLPLKQNREDKEL